MIVTLQTCSHTGIYKITGIPKQMNCSFLLFVSKNPVKQKAFADYYIELGNATEAYIKAGYKASERKVAEVEGCKLLKNPMIDNYIKK